MSANTGQTPNTLEVRVTNWQPTDNGVHKTTFNTYVIDPDGVDGPSSVQICDYNPSRMRLVLITPESDVVLTLDSPINVPDPTVSTLAPQGAFISHTVTSAWEFYGPDAMWLKSVLGQSPGRVTVIQEYC